MRLLPLLISLSFQNVQRPPADDSLICSGKYDKDSLKHGVWVCRSGRRVVKREKFKHGKSLGYIVYDKKGRMIETKDRKGRQKTYQGCGC